MGDGLWKHTGRTDKPEPEKANIKPKKPVQTSTDRGHLGADGEYYENATAYYRAIDNK